MCLWAVLLEGQTLSAIIGVCLLIIGVATFAWGQWAWEKQTKVGRMLLVLLSAVLIAAGLMFLGFVNYLDQVWGI
ncbi:MAG TPA: hypothetical protein VKU02_04850 [Gemmataceae bacterium]|nr:hypothetical protein [Gemmataceae bacterium]